MDKLIKYINKLLKICINKDINCIIILNDGKNITAFMNEDNSENFSSLKTVLSNIKPEKQTKPILYH